MYPNKANKTNVSPKTDDDYCSSSFFNDFASIHQQEFLQMVLRYSWKISLREETIQLASDLRLISFWWLPWEFAVDGRPHLRNGGIPKTIVR